MPFLSYGNLNKGCSLSTLLALIFLPPHHICAFFYVAISGMPSVSKTYEYTTLCFSETLSWVSSYTCTRLTIS